MLFRRLWVRDFPFAHFVLFDGFDHRVRTLLVLVEQAFVVEFYLLALLLVPVFEEVDCVLANFETAFVFLLDDRVLVLLDFLLEVVLFECDAFALFFGFLSCVGGCFRSSLGFCLCVFGCLFAVFLGLLSGGFLTGFLLLCGTC